MRKPTVCQNAAQPEIIFEVDDNVYLYIHFIPCLSEPTVLTTVEVNKSVTVSCQQMLNFTYILTGVKDKDGTAVAFLITIQ
jgi:hypothetical protein